MKKTLLYLLFWIISLTWGLLITLVGAAAAVVLLLGGHKPHRFGPNIYFRVGSGWGGVNFGPFFITDMDSDESVFLHEAGHGLQNLIWGPLFPFVVSIPSAARYWYREFLWETDREKYWTLPDYDAIWFEGQATQWGTKVYSHILNEKKEG